ARESQARTGPMAGQGRQDARRNLARRGATAATGDGGARAAAAAGSASWCQSTSRFSPDSWRVTAGVEPGDREGRAGGVAGVARVAGGRPTRAVGAVPTRRTALQGGTATPG